MHVPVIGALAILRCGRSFLRCSLFCAVLALLPCTYHSLGNLDSMPSATASSYFLGFSDFVPHPSTSIEQEFARLASSRQWSSGSKRYKQERRKFLLSEYDHHVGYIQTANDVSQWQDLCRELGIDNPPQSIKDCKKVKTIIY